MKRFNILILLCLCYWSLFCDTDEGYIQELVNERIIERISQSFTTIPGSSRFVEKFGLNEKEIELIGMWVFDGSINKVPEHREYGPGIAITFYPNRFFYIYREGEDIGQIKEVLGEWKVENGKLLIRLRAKIIILNNKNSDSIYEKYRVEYHDSVDYYSIFVVPKYERLFVNTQAFNWGNIPVSLADYYKITNNDKPRSRLLFDTLGVPPGNIQKGSQLGELLYNPVISDKYFLDLVHNAW